MMGLIFLRHWFDLRNYKNGCILGNVNGIICEQPNLVPSNDFNKVSGQMSGQINNCKDKSLIQASLYSSVILHKQALALKLEVIVIITRAKDSMADNSPTLRAQLEDEDYFHHNIRGNAL